MRGFYLPDENIGFIVSHRSASRLILSTLKHFFDFSNIKYETIEYQKIHKFVDKSNKSRFYLICRHPIERAISGYSWVLKNKEKKEYSTYYKKFKLETISDYVKNLENILKKDYDAHFLPQTYDLLSLDNAFSVDDFKKINLRKKFDDFYYDYKIIHVEEIRKLINIDKENIEKITPTDLSGYLVNLKCDALRIFDHFQYSPETLCNKFTSVYNMFENFLNKKHNFYGQIFLQPNDYECLTEFFYDEIVFYGYNDYDITNRIAHPEEINLKNII